MSSSIGYKKALQSLLVMLSALTLGIAGNRSAFAQSAISLSSAEMTGLIDAAKKERTILLYTLTSADKLPAWVKPFEEKYGITVKYYRAASNAAFNRFAQEETAGRHLADIVGLSEPLLIRRAISKGWAAKYVPQNAGKYDPSFVIHDTAYPLYLIAHGFGWNSTKVTPQQKQQLLENGYQALLDPSLKGNIALVAPVGGGQEASYYEVISDPKLGWGYLEKLAAQKPVVSNSALTMTTGMTSGEYAVGFPSSDTSIWPAIQQGAPLEFAYSSPSVTSLEQVFISSKAPHPNAARLFLEWATTLEAQNALSIISSGIMAHKDWKDDRAIANAKFYRAPVKLDNSWSEDPKFAENIVGIIKRWHALFGQP